MIFSTLSTFIVIPCLTRNLRDFLDPAPLSLINPHGHFNIGEVFNVF